MTMILYAHCMHTSKEREGEGERGRGRERERERERLYAHLERHGEVAEPLGEKPDEGVAHRAAHSHPNHLGVELCVRVCVCISPPASTRYTI